MGKSNPLSKSQFRQKVDIVLLCSEPSILRNTIYCCSMSHMAFGGNVCSTGPTDSCVVNPFCHAETCNMHEWVVPVLLLHDGWMGPMQFFDSSPAY